MRLYDEIGLLIPEIYLPKPGTDLNRWAVVACDQYTSQPEYWEQVERLTGEAPSTYNLILPEYFLGKPQEEERIPRVRAKMREYLDQGVLQPVEGMVYVERQVGQKMRRGLVVALDLERYDFHKGSDSLIRATEGTIIERLPPRMRIREGAALELPHILVLIDDPERTVIEPLANATGEMKKVYDFDLMMDSGHLTGYLVEDRQLEEQIAAALSRLADPAVFSQKYGVEKDEKVLLYAMGDGNHSLATAKAVWEKLKPQVGMDHPARYALVEIENVHDQGLDFEPIHRALFGLKVDIFAALKETFGENMAILPCNDCMEMERHMGNTRGGKQAFGVTWEHNFAVVEITDPSSNLAVGTLQTFLDKFIAAGKAESIDYLHGNCTVCKVTSQPKTAGFFLPCMEKSELFRTVILDGALPRKTFSMGEAWEKRFYMECRKIV